MEFESRTESHLRHKIARLANRKRILYKRTTNHIDNNFRRRCREMEKEARDLRLTLMRLRRNRSNQSNYTCENYQIPNDDNDLATENTFRQNTFTQRNARGTSSRPRNNEVQNNHHRNEAHREVTHENGPNTALSRWEFGPRTAVCPDCKALMWIEERVKGSSKTQPRFNQCCQNGKVSMPLLPPTPPYLSSLLADQQFRPKSRTYNSLLSFTSTGGKIDNTVNDGRGPYVFRISGSNHHRIGSLLPQSGQQPKFAQLYIYDTCNETRNRLNAMGSGPDGSVVCPKTLQGLQNMLDDINPYVGVFRNASNMLAGQGQMQDLRIKLIHAREGRQYIQPTGDEVAALMVGDGTEELGNRDVVLQTLDGRLQRIDETHPSYMPLQYPLLFPYGTDGWTTGIPKVASTSTSRTTVTMRQALSYRMQDREEEGDTLIDGGRLFQQFSVDGCAAMEHCRLLFLKRNQGKLRTDLYSGLQDAITAGEVNASAIGRRYILPSSFTGGPRNMVQHYQDAMAIVRVLGPPDFFITMTCNPKWPEIVNEISARGIRRAEDRPDIVARVFKIKLKKLLQILKDEKKFGKVIADLYIIEFQKRGLPHAHILITLDPDDKPKCPEDIDRIICAEIPDKDNDPLAYETVTKNMIHGPCGPCLKDGKCSKHYPKKFSNETSFDANGFVQYRRRQRDPIIINGREVDNRWVVPYNRDLCVIFNAHINMERVAARSVVKYLYKYVTKGHDRATFVIEDNTSTRNDQQRLNRVEEIQQYLDCRYISAIEACWRIFEFSLQHQYPSTQLLQFHLPDEQLVVFNDDDDLFTILDQPRLQETMLTMWFQANKDYPEANYYTYQDFPMYWVWNRSLRRWTKREQRFGLGRLPFVHPTSGERYYLRMLLTKVRGAKSFEDIRTIRGVVHSSYRSACNALGLLNDDSEWHGALSEASSWATGAQLRNMFCSILMFTEVSNPRQLWEQHWEELTDDLEKMMQRQTRNPNLQLTLEETRNLGLLEIEHALNRVGKTLSDYPDMPCPSNPLHNALNRLIRDELDYDAVYEGNRFEELVRGINTDQYKVYAAVCDAHHQDIGGIFFVYGSGGTGKTYLWNTLISKFRSEKKVVLSVASSGIASLLLPGGKTAHSTFKIPFDPDQNSVCGFKKDSSRADLIREAALIIWDEAPMTHRLALEAVDRHFKDICNDNRAFGGKLVVLGGDFRQILLVVPNEGREAIVAATLHRASFWGNCKLMHLRINMRLHRSQACGENQQQIKEFAEWILKVGEGKIPAVSITEEGEPCWIEISNELLIGDDTNGLRNLINFVYPGLPLMYKDWEYLKERGILAPTNDDVDELNLKILSMIPGDVHSYYSSDTLGHSGDGGFLEGMEPTELLNSLDISGLPNHRLDLTVGVPVILLRNMNQSIGLCNGTRLTIKKLGHRVIEAQVITGPRSGDAVLIPRIDLMPSNKKIELPLKRRQFPLKLAFAMTINKSQGQTLNTVGIFLPRPVFSHGQLYVAVSRVTSPSGLKILIKNKKEVPSILTKNIVYKEVLNNVN